MQKQDFEQEVSSLLFCTDYRVSFGACIEILEQNYRCPRYMPRSVLCCHPAKFEFRIKLPKLREECAAPPDLTTPHRPPRRR
jgi:hypothetical protein